MALAIIALVALLYVVIAWAVRTLATATSSPHGRRAAIAAAAALMVLFVGDRADAVHVRGVSFCATVTAMYGHQAVLIARGLKPLAHTAAEPLVSRRSLVREGADVRCSSSSRTERSRTNDRSSQTHWRRRDESLRRRWPTADIRSSPPSSNRRRSAVRRGFAHISLLSGIEVTRSGYQRAVVARTAGDDAERVRPSGLTGRWR